MDTAITAETRKKRLKKGAQGWLRALPFILPGLILVAVFVVYPMLFTIRISLSEYKIVQGDITFIGLENFKNVLAGGSRFWYAYRNNFLYAIVTGALHHPGRHVLRLSHKQPPPRPGHLPRGLLPAGHHLLGHRVPGVPVHVQQLQPRPHQLLPRGRAARHGRLCPLAAARVVRQRGHLADGHLEEHGLGHDNLPCGPAEHTP